MRAYGRPGADLHAQLTIDHPDAWSGPLRGSLGLGETYVEGLWETDDLVSLLRIGARELRRLEGAVSALDRPRTWVHRLRGLVPENTRSGAREHISAHYDLGNDLFSAFLDPSMTYSCAFFADEATGLDEAQIAKLDRICEKLRLGPRDHLLEIGTGWGGLAIHAASRYGCRVTTTTISGRQHALAAERVRAAGLEDRVTLLMEDYRDLRGRYDKLVSIEMIEAVGWQYFDCVLRPLQRSAGARRADAAAGDRHRRPPLRGREGGTQLRQHPHLPRRLPAVERPDRRLRGAGDRPAGGLDGGHNRPLPAHPCRLARALPRRLGRAQPQGL